MRYGYAIRTGGDQEISEALERGIKAGTGTSLARGRIEAASVSADGGRLTEDQMEVVMAEIDRQHILEALVRVAVGNGKTAEDYALMQIKARAEYDRADRRPAWLRKLAERALGLYGLLCYALAAAYRAQDAVLDTEGRGRG